MRSPSYSCFLRLLSIPCVALVGALTAGPAVARPLFPNPVVDTGNNPSAVVIVDVNGDGFKDQVVGDYGQDAGGPPGLSVLLGQGDGTFTALAFRGLSGSPGFIEASDLNGDGSPDLVLSLFYPLSVKLLFGNGDGTFGPEQSIALSGAPAWVSVGDFDGDFKSDLLVVYSTPATQVLFGRGDGTFAAGPINPMPFPGRVAVGDVNADAKDDFVIWHGDFDYVVVATSRGDGTFSMWTSSPAGGSVYAATLADVTGDGRADLALEARVSYYVFTIFTFVGAGDGTFNPSPSYSIDDYAGKLMHADLNGDGRGDLISLSPFGVLPLISRGDGTFDAKPAFQAGDGNNDLAAGDFDADGRPDLAVVAGQSNASFIFFGNGDGTFGPTGQPFPYGASPDGVATADFNGDGNKDLAIVNSSTDDVSVVLGNGDGTFGPETRYNTGVTPWAIVAADFNGDGAVDLAVTTFNWSSLQSPPVPPGEVDLLLGRGDGRFLRSGTFAVGMSPRSIAAADFNGDGLLDLVTANEGVSDFGLYGDLSVLLATTGGTFAPETRVAAGVSPTSVAVGDFDGDQRADLAVADRGDYQYFGGGIPGDFSVLLGAGDGTFGSLSVLAQGSVPRSVAVADLDGDGRDDVAAVDEGTFDHGGPFTPGHLTVFLGQASGHFTTGGSVEAGISPYHVDIADFTGDGVKDLLLSNDAYYVSLFPGAGDGTFLPQERFGYGQIQFIIGGDFNADGSPDLAVVSTGGFFILTPGGAGPLVQDLFLSTNSPYGKGSGTLSWTTSREVDLRSFNVLTIDNTGRRVLQNLAPIPCEECTTGLGHAYLFILPKHKSAKDVYVEAVHQDGRVERFGPARKR